MDKAKKTAIAQHVFEQETVSARASSLASSYLLSGNPYFDDDYVDGVRAVTAEQVLAAAQRYLDNNRMNIAVIKPQSAGGQGAAAPECEPAKTPPVEFSRLDNGLKTLIKQDSNLPIVTLQLFGNGGLSFETLERPGLSAFTVGLLTAGTKSTKKLDLLRKVENAGGEISVQSDNNTYHVSIKVLKEDFDWALGLLADIAQNSQFPQDEIEKQRQDTLIAIKKLDESWQAEVIATVQEKLFPENFLCKRQVGNAGVRRAFTREEILAFYRKILNPHSFRAGYVRRYRSGKSEAARAARVRKMGRRAGGKVNAR